MIGPVSVETESMVVFIMLMPVDGLATVKENGESWKAIWLKLTFVRSTDPDWWERRVYERADDVWWVGMEGEGANVTESRTKFPYLVSISVL